MSSTVVIKFPGTNTRTPGGVAAYVQELGFMPGEIQAKPRKLTKIFQNVLLDVEDIVNKNLPFGGLMYAAPRGNEEDYQRYYLGSTPRGLIVAQRGSLIGFIPSDKDDLLTMQAWLPKGLGALPGLLNALCKVATASQLEVVCPNENIITN